MVGVDLSPGVKLRSRELKKIHTTMILACYVWSKTAGLEITGHFLPLFLSLEDRHFGLKIGRK